MSADLLQPPAYIAPAEALQISQQAPHFFKSQAPSVLPYPLSILTGSESPEQWHTYENLLVSCLRTGDDESAFLCVKQLTERFGESNERVQFLSGLYKEATAADDKALEKVLKSYDDIIKEAPTNFPIRKRRVALLKSMGRTADAIKALTELLNSSPIDAEAWAELSDLYFSQGLYSQAVFSLEEVLLVTPNAWNMHARLGEVTYVAARASEDTGEQLKLLANAMRHFCRSIELCDDYLRGYYGLHRTTSLIISTFNKSSKPLKVSSDLPGDLAPPSLESVKKLDEKATAKLAEIVRRAGAGEKGWDGYDQAELKAVRELINQDTQSIER